MSGLIREKCIIDGCENMQVSRGRKPNGQRRYSSICMEHHDERRGKKKGYSNRIVKRFLSNKNIQKSFTQKAI